MGDPVLDVFGPVRFVSEIAVVVDQLTLRFETGVDRPESFQGRGDETGRQLLAAAVGASHDPTDAYRCVVTEETDVGSDPGIVLDPDVFGVGVEVPAIDFWVGALLLDDEDIDAQAQDGVELLGRESGADNDMFF